MKEIKTSIPPLKKYTSPDGTVRYVKCGQLHNPEGPAFIPEGNIKKAEYYVYGIRYTKEEFEDLNPINTAKADNRYI